MHYNQVHMGMKRFRNEVRVDKCRRESCEFAGTTNCLELESHKLHKLKCRRESCENVGTTNCLELETHSLFFCNQCQLSFGRIDSLKFHNDKVHKGLFFKCEYCETFTTAWKVNLTRHILSKHPDADPKQNRMLKQHIETKHEGVVRFKCHVMNCSFGSSRSKDLRRHARTHEKESSKLSVKSKGKFHKNPFVTCDQENCKVKVENKRELKTHIAESHKGAIKYSCQLANCNFETYWERSLLKHLKGCKHKDLKSVTSTEIVSLDKKTSSKEEVETSEKPQKSLFGISGSDFISSAAKETEMQDNVQIDHADSEFHFISSESGKQKEVEHTENIDHTENISGKPQKSLCSIPGCDFISNGSKEREMQDHFQTVHTDSEFTEDSFIVINSAMAEAMEILQEIQESKKET